MKVCPVCQREYPVPAGADTSPATHCADDGVPLVAMVADLRTRSEDLVGQIVEGRYKIERIIGKGGMGTVYACRHVVVGKLAAMKVLRTNSEHSEGVLQRFVQEAKTANLLRSRHIAEVSDFGQLPSGSFFVVMELLEGKDLARAMRDGLDRRALVHVFTQVAETLQLAHDMGIVHRDLKPDNVFLVHDAGDPLFVKLLDFGIAKILHGDNLDGRALTETGVVLGTPYYMSPEQARADALDHRSDIYSLGVMMYRAFTGRLPFVADSTMGVLTRHITEAPQPPSQVGNVDQITEQLILRCLAKRPEYRFQSMRELCEALTHVPLQPVPALREQPTVYDGPTPGQASQALQPSQAAVRAAVTTGARAVQPAMPSGPYAQAQGPSGAYPQAHAQGPSGAYAQAQVQAQGPSGAYPQARAPSGPYPQASASYPQVPSGAYPQAASGPYPQAVSGPYPQVPSGAYPQAPGVPIVVGVAPGAASTGTMTALHMQGGHVGGEIATTRGVVAVAVPQPARGPNTALLLVGGIGMAALGAALVLFMLARSSPAGANAGVTPVATAVATAAPAVRAAPTASAAVPAPSAAVPAPSAAVLAPTASATAAPSATAPRPHGGPLPRAVPAPAPAAPPPVHPRDIRSPFE